MTQFDFFAGSNHLPAVLRTMPVRHHGDRYDLLQGDSLQLLQTLPERSVDLVFADPPYNLSNGGTSMQSGKRVTVDKGDWDVSRGLAEDHAFHTRWLAGCQRVLKTSGTIWVSGTHHCLFSVGYAMQALGYRVLNLITWFKPNAKPNLSCRMYTHSTEGLIWAAPYDVDPLPHLFHYAAIRAASGDKLPRDLWRIPSVPMIEKQHGRHPTQKPMAVLDRVFATCGRAGDVWLDPFNGSGTTAVVAGLRGAHYIGMDLDAGHLDLTARRLTATDLGVPYLDQLAQRLAQVATGEPDEEPEADDEETPGQEGSSTLTLLPPV